MRIVKTAFIVMELKPVLTITACWGMIPVPVNRAMSKQTHVLLPCAIITAGVIPEKTVAIVQTTGFAEMEQCVETDFARRATERTVFLARRTVEESKTAVLVNVTAVAMGMERSEERRVGKEC